MEVEKIVILSADNDLERVEKVIESISQINKSLILGKIIYGRVGKDNILSFNTDRNYYRYMIEKLRLNKIKVISKVNLEDEEEIKAMQRKTASKTSPGWSDLRRKSQNVLPIEKMAIEGRYEDILKITKDIRNGQNNIAEAVGRLPEALNSAIENALRNFHSSKHRQEESLDILFNISGKSFFKTPKYAEFIKRAALLIVDLVGSRKDQLYELINVCNNNNIHHIGPVKAAVKFQQITSKEPVKFEDDIYYAVKKLNLRWLLICYPMVEHELSGTEKKHFDNLVDYIRSKR